MAGTRVPVDLDSVIPDRIGGPGGSCLGRDGDLFHERAVPPDRLDYVRTSFDIDIDRARQVGTRAEQSRVAPAFGQPGGGTQYQFFRPGHDTPLSQRELEDLGVLGRRAP